jgi:malonyl-CoA/methylmalonyl-CoA synthetase
MHDNPDRSELVPPHSGPNVLPNSPLFGKLLRHAHRERIALRDLGLDVEKTYGSVSTKTIEQLAASLRVTV